MDFVDYELDYSNHGYSFDLAKKVKKGTHTNYTSVIRRSSREKFCNGATLAAPLAKTNRLQYVAYSLWRQCPRVFLLPNLREDHPFFCVSCDSGRRDPGQGLQGNLLKGTQIIRHKVELQQSTSKQKSTRRVACCTPANLSVFLLVLVQSTYMSTV